MSRIRCNILFKKRRLYQSLCRCFLSNSSDREINVVKSKVPDIFIPNNELLHEYVWKNVDKWYNKTALVRIISNKYDIARQHCQAFK